MTDRSGSMGRLERLLDGVAFPAFTLSLLVFYELLLLGLLLAPSAADGIGAFADEFRVWCFGYDPATGRMEWGYVVAMTAPPASLGAVLALLWWESFRGALARPARLLAPVLTAALVAGASAAAFAALGSDTLEGELPFPAEALRTAHRAPGFVLESQTGEHVDPARLRGRVVLLTAVYASCPHTCPLILAQVKRALAELSPAERSDLRVVAVTLDPGHDSPEVLAELARLQELDAPLYSLVTGSVAEVERVLDEMGVARRRDPDTGVIDHANLFLLLDRDGRVAYRLTLGERQERWMVSALRVLLREGTDAG